MAAAMLDADELIKTYPAREEAGEKCGLEVTTRTRTSGVIVDGTIYALEQ
jgi:hypothetical protein